MNCDILNQAKYHMKVDFQTCGNTLDHSKVDVGFSADKSLKELVRSKVNISRLKLRFRVECRNFVHIKSAGEISDIHSFSEIVIPGTVATESCEQNVAAFRTLGAACVGAMAA